MRAGLVIGAGGQCRALCPGDEAMQCLRSQPSRSRGTRRIAVSGARKSVLNTGTLCIVRALSTCAQGSSNHGAAVVFNGAASTQVVIVHGLAGMGDRLTAMFNDCLPDTAHVHHHGPRPHHFDEHPLLRTGQMGYRRHAPHATHRPSNQDGVGHSFRHSSQTRSELKINQLRVKRQMNVSCHGRELRRTARHPASARNSASMRAAQRAVSASTRRSPKTCSHRATARAAIRAAAAVIAASRQARAGWAPGAGRRRGQSLLSTVALTLGAMRRRRGVGP
jgi:hypothetical protein